MPGKPQPPTLKCLSGPASILQHLQGPLAAVGHLCHKGVDEVGAGIILLLALAYSFEKHSKSALDDSFPGLSTSNFQ